MNRYRSTVRKSNNSQAATPIVAFILIACFGLLFVTGCGSQIAGPAEVMEDDTFTAEDLERFQELSSAGESENASVAASAASLAASPVSSPVSSLAPVDPALRKRNDALRASSSGQANLYRVTNAFVNVRSSPSVSAPSAGRLEQGELVAGVEFLNGTWAKIRMPDGKEGYIASRYISKLVSEEKLKEEQKTFENWYFVNFAFLNVRAAPNSGSEKIGEIGSQVFVKPLSIDKDWARVTFEGKEGHVSTQYLSPFRPNMLVRQDRYQLPVLHYKVDQESVLPALTQHVAALKQAGVTILALRDLHGTVLTQEVRDVRIPPKSVVLAVTGLTAENIRVVSDALNGAGVTATFFIQTDRVGLSGISEKTLLTLQANGFDLQSAGHTGDDMRTLTDAQTQLELVQSRALLEDMTKKEVFAIAYPHGGANDRVLNQAADAGYLFGLGTAPDKMFSRDQFLRLPSYTISAGMTAEDVLQLTK